MTSVSLSTGRMRSRRRRGLVEGTLRHLARAATRSQTAERLAHGDGLLQSLDPRIKVVGLLALVVGSALAANLVALLGLLVVGAALAYCSRVRILGLAKRLWLRLLLFTGPLALPAIFLMPGDVVFRLPMLDWPVTSQGLRGAAFLVLRGGGHDLFTAAGAVHALGAHPQSAARGARAGGAGLFAGDDPALHLPAAASCP